MTTDDEEKSNGSGNTRRYHDTEDRPRRLRAHILSVLTIISGLYYLAWASYHYDVDHPVMAGLYIAGEAFV